MSRGERIDSNRVPNGKGFGKERAEPSDPGLLPGGDQDSLGDYVQRVQQKQENSEELSFLDTLELEHARLSRNLSSRTRDSLLLRLNLDIESFNPDRFIYPRDEKTESTCSSVGF